MEHQYWWSWYVIVSFVFTMWVSLQVPTKMSRGGSITGSFMVGLFGFMLWPLLLIALIIMKRKHKAVTTHVEYK